MLHQLGFLTGYLVQTAVRLCVLQTVACASHRLMLECHSMWLLIMHGIVKERRALFQTLMIVAAEKAKCQMVVPDGHARWSCQMVMSLFMHLAQAPQLSYS